MRKRDPKANLTRQAVSNWFQGNNLPPNELVPDLAEILGSTPEYIMFGKRRGEQLKSERVYLSRISEDEGELLTLFRGADKPGQRIILSTIRSIAQEHPAPNATIHQWRRKDDPKP